MNTSPDWYYLPVVIVGIVSFLSGYFNWKWWMNNPRARQLSSLFGGNDHARQFYMIIGGIFMATGLIGFLSSYVI